MTPTAGQSSNKAKYEAAPTAEIIDIIRTAMGQGCIRPCHVYDAVDELIRRIQALESRPKRNCDVGTDDYVIVDTESRTNRLFSADTEYIPWILHAFTDRIDCARIYYSRERAEADCDRFTKTKFEFDGNTPLKPGRLKVMKLALVPVEQQGE